MPKTANHEIYVKKYAEESLIKAIEDVNDGMPKREACRKYKIPRATLQFRLSEKFTKSSHGPSPILTTNEEAILVKWIRECQRKGFPRRKEDIQISVKQFLDDSPRENPFKDNLPGDGWYKAFMKRHPELTTRKSEGVSAASSAISEQDIRKWFDGIHSYLSQKGYNEVLEHPERLFNADETNFQLCPQNKRVIAPKGTKNVYEVDLGKAKTTLTVLFTFSAAGSYTPPLIIYPGKRLRKEIGDSIPEEFTFATSDTGWMKTEIFYEYVANSFYPHLKKIGIQFPVILFVDGHKTHIDRKLSDLCTNLGIILVALYPNATRILQPADVSTFKPLKDGWRKGVIEWRRSNPTEELSKKEFAGLLKVVISKSIRPEIIINGFKACGLYPWNPNAIDFSKCLGKKKTDSNILLQTNDENVITFSKFKDIIGPTKVNLFTNIDIQLERDEDIILYKLWKEFQNTNTEIIQERETNILENVEENLQTEIGNALTKDGVEIANYNSNDVNTPETLADMSEVNILSAPILIEDDGVWHEITLNNLEKIAVDDSMEIVEDNPNEITTANSNEMNINNANRIIMNDPIGNTTNNITQGELDKGTIEQYLHYPNTPQRKGKKTSQKTSFILSSSSWKRFHDDKELKKQTELAEKENRKRERELNKVNREKAALEKRKKQEMKGPKKSKLDKRTTASSKKISKDILLPLSIEKNILDQKRNFFTADNSYDTLECPNNNAHASPSTRFTTKAQIHQNETNMESEKAHFKNNKTNEIKINILSQRILPPLIEEKKLYNVTRKLEFEEPNRNPYEHIDEVEDPMVDVNKLIFIRNNLNSGLCFSCTRNITSLNSGVRCENCTRCYHTKCIFKHNMHKSNSNIFTCQTCLKRHQKP